MDIIGLLQEQGVDYREHGSHHHCGPGWVQVDCPLCSPGSKRFRLGFSLRKTMARCWSCGPVPPVKAFRELTRLSFEECRRLLGGVDHTAVGPRRTRGTYKPPVGVGPLLGVHREYLEGRGLNPDVVARVWGVGGIGQEPGPTAWRLFIPVEFAGRPVSWTTRAISARGLRYLSASPEHEALPHKELLYGEDQVPGNAVVVVEGPVDVWSVGPGAVCTFGTAFTETQVLRLSRYPLRAVAFDSEPIAQRLARSLCERLSAFPGATWRLEWGAGKDAAEQGERTLAELRTRFLDGEPDDPLGQ
jgi:hypothetical protein